MNVGDKFIIKAAGNEGAEWAIKDGEVTIGKEYIVERKQGAKNWYFRDNTGVLIAVHCFHFGKV